MEKLPKDLVIVDFSYLSMRMLFSSTGQTNPGKRDGFFKPEDFMPYYKHLLFSSLKEISMKFKGCDIFLALDSSDNWRKGAYIGYKAHRSDDREKSDIDFNQFYKDVNEILAILGDIFPFGLLKVHRTEADDIAGVIAKTYGISNNITLITSDHDYHQLIENNVKQYDPMKKCYITLEPGELDTVELLGETMSKFAIKHSLVGDPGDGVPKITSGTAYSDNFNDYLKSKDIKLEAPHIIEKREDYNDLIEKYDVYIMWKSGKKKGQFKDIKDIYNDPQMGKGKVDKLANDIDSLKKLLTNEIYAENFKRNRELVDMNHIPQIYKDQIIENFKAQTIEYDLSKIMKYFMEQDLNKLAGDYQDFRDSSIKNNEKTSLDDFF